MSTVKYYIISSISLHVVGSVTIIIIRAYNIIGVYIVYNNTASSIPARLIMVFEWVGDNTIIRPADICGRYPVEINRSICQVRRQSQLSKVC